MIVAVTPSRIIHATAPIRVCDNGGWTDTWVARHGAVFNIAVQPLVHVRLAVFPAGSCEARVVRRNALGAGASLEGPAIVEEEDSTTLLEPGDRLSVLADGTLAIEVAAGADWIW